MKKKRFHYATERYVNKVVSWQEKGLKTYLISYVDFVKKYVKPGSRILDLGCGAGLSSSMLSKDYNVTGADFSLPMIKYARENFKNVTFRHEDARKLSFKDGSFDAVMACGFIEHVREVDVVLDEMLRVVKKKGLVIIVSPNWFSPLRAIRGIVKPKGYETIGRNRLQIFWWFLKAWFYSAKKLISPKYVFRNPDIYNEEIVGDDIDMEYIANPYDLKSAFEKRGCRVLRLTAPTFRFSYTAFLAIWFGVVAKKSGK